MMRKIQLQSAYGGPGMIVTERDPYFVKSMYLADPIPGAYAAQANATADTAVGAQESVLYPVAEATA
ncbi:MAG: hypothetical protein V1648_01955 [Candidatus Aenigmatarchaeota archaeon]